VPDLDIVYSPDDGGYYAQEFLDAGGSRVSKEIYETRLALVRALADGTHEWEDNAS